MKRKLTLREKNEIFGQVIIGAGLGVAIAYGVCITAAIIYNVFIH